MSMDKEPLVSVVIPMWNRENTIARALKSVEQQTYSNCEIVVVDDFSTDNSIEVAKGIDLPNVKFIEQSSNKGGAAARNAGIQAANGEYIAFLDSDDEWLPTKLEKQIKVFNGSSDEVGVVYTGFWEEQDNQRTLGNIPVKRGYIYEDELYKDWISPTSAVMVRKELLERVGGFDESLEARQDYNLWLRLSEITEFQFVQEPLVVLHVDSTNRLTDNVQGKIEALSTTISDIEQRIESFPQHKKNKIMANQYFTLARYLQKKNVFIEARRYILKSIKNNPAKISSWITLFFILVHKDQEFLGKIRRKLNWKTKRKDKNA